MQQDLTQYKQDVSLAKNSSRKSDPYRSFLISLGVFNGINHWHDRQKEAASDPAMNISSHAPGGIDLNAGNLSLQVKGRDLIQQCLAGCRKRM